MAHSWLDISEVVTGLVIDGQLNPAMVRAELLMSPYDQVLTAIANGRDVTALMDQIGLSTMSAAVEASRSMTSVNQYLPVDWTKLLAKAAHRNQAAAMLSKQVKKLERGEDADRALLQKAIEMMDNTDEVIFKTAADIDPAVGIWRPTYYYPLDKHTGPPEDPAQMGGVPEGGLVVVGAPPGTGKTSFGAKILTSSAKAGKKVAIWSCEMLAEQITYRMIQIGQLTPEERANVFVIAGRSSADEVYTQATRLVTLHPDLHLIVVDFADLLVVGEESEQTVAYVYLRMQELASRTGVPVILLSQLNRQTYLGGVPKINHLRYSGLAEALGALVLLLYNPKQILISGGQMDEKLPLIPGRGYICVGKSRFGFKEGGVGAIAVEWDGQTAWGDTSFGYYLLNN